MISYDVESVRVRYSGENDANGHAVGLDLQLRGEFVPGMQGWISYSFLWTRERFKPEHTSSLNQGWIPRPTDQRHTFSLFVQDYFPEHPEWPAQVRVLFGSGTPYTPPIGGKGAGGLVKQVPGSRSSARYPPYFRFDLGLAREFTFFRRGSRPTILEVGADILNLFGMANVVAYSWIPRSNGRLTRVPTRLTPRTLNVRVRVDY